ncbi:MAG TPA: hypothetical protein VK674_01085 [Candidatus Limnocylindria bacterium]|nr:hypothetical protein [Candidatus Limnocylindria bacterium]
MEESSFIAAEQNLNRWAGGLHKLANGLEGDVSIPTVEERANILSAADAVADALSRLREGLSAAKLGDLLLRFGTFEQIQVGDSVKGIEDMSEARRFVAGNLVENGVAVSGVRVAELFVLGGVKRESASPSASRFLKALRNPRPGSGEEKIAPYAHVWKGQRTYRRHDPTLKISGLPPYAWYIGTDEGVPNEYRESPDKIL